jgi:hypothetical protein
LWRLLASFTTNAWGCLSEKRNGYPKNEKQGFIFGFSSCWRLRPSLTVFVTDFPLMSHRQDGDNIALIAIQHNVAAVAKVNHPLSRSNVTFRRLHIVPIFQLAKPGIGFLRCHMQAVGLVLIPCIDAILPERFTFFFTVNVLTDGFSHQPV